MSSKDSFQILVSGGYFTVIIELVTSHGPCNKGLLVLEVTCERRGKTKSFAPL